MNGPKHYAEAERLLTSADNWKAEEGDHAAADYCVSQALVHATLAQAAAIADLHAAQAYGEWGKVLAGPSRAAAWAEVLDS